MSVPVIRAVEDVPGWDHLVTDGLTTSSAFATRADEHAALRAVAALDLGLARVLDGHRNALERLLHHCPDQVADDDRGRAAEGVVPHGVWGADPRGAEGTPATIAGDHVTVSGTKVFCSGAGLVERALILVRPEIESPGSVCALVDVSDPARVIVDRDWFRGPALRSSASHRVVLDRAPILAILGLRPGDGPDRHGAGNALLDEPWFSGDALRTAVTWAGALDTVFDGTIAALRDRTPSDAEAVLVARAAAARATVDRWLEHATAVRDREPVTVVQRAVLQARLEITERCREVLRICAELTGSHPIATDARTARTRGDLDLLLLQHRLTPAATRLGHDLLAEGSQ
ncbi:hypothetical protein [Patulibacter minatonensis]|uniref:hypothetical protein n=1 Tax=Patulibacter minatonensis TaxID=298163 RepID=UPI00047891A5|nr:hypothetical protein [Patulibacter minatonensis]